MTFMQHIYIVADKWEIPKLCFGSIWLCTACLVKTGFTENAARKTSRKDAITESWRKSQSAGVPLEKAIKGWD